jgi:hypothetical protein
MKFAWALRNKQDAVRAEIITKDLKVWEKLVKLKIGMNMDNNIPLSEYKMKMANA